MPTVFYSTKEDREKDKQKEYDCIFRKVKGHDNTDFNDKKDKRIAADKPCIYWGIKMTVGSRVKQAVSNLKGIESTLEIYILQSQDSETSSVYEEAVVVIKEVLKDLEQRVQTLEFEEPQYKGL